MGLSISPSWLRYANQSATRSRPLAPEMYDALSFLPELGVTMEVFSGGQPTAGNGPRVGSTRHDHGNAADVFFYKDGRKLDWSNPDDLPLFQQIVSQGRANGLTGFGAGDGYMQPGSMHIGFGTEAVWGAGGKGANAPDWLRSAYYGADAPARPAVMSTNSPRPQGLLSAPTQEAAPMQKEKIGGLLGRLFPDMDADRADELRLSLNGMLHNPNEGRARAIEARMGGRAEGRERQAAAQQAQQQANRTAQWLASQPGGQQYAQAIASGALPAGEALTMWRAASQGQEPTALMQNVEYIRQQTPGMSMQDALQMAKSGTTVNVNGQAPSPATGYRNVFDDQGRLVAQEPIPGGPVATEMEQAAEQEQQRQQSAENQQGVRDTVIGRDVDRLIGMIDQGGIFDLPETGIIGGMLGSLGINQDAVDFKNTLAGIQATVAFDRLQQMRDASKTGGALGAVSERELDLLISAYGALQQNTSGPVLKSNLQTIKDVMTKIANDPVASSFYYGGGQTSQGQAPSGGFSVTGRID